MGSLPMGRKNVACRVPSAAALAFLNRCEIGLEGAISELFLW